MGVEASSALFDAIAAAFPHLLPEPFASKPRREDMGISPDVLSGDDLKAFVASGRSGGFASALQRVGNCARPILLRGESSRFDTATGAMVAHYSSGQEPDGLTRIKCGNRRASACPACSREYAADVFHMIRAGVAGGKTVPESVADNPLVFVTVTAPSFGRVHGRRDGTGLCHPGRGGMCEHGNPTRCAARHREGEEILGQPLCAECYDYESQVIWQYCSTLVWKRFTIALRRAIARRLGIPATRLAAVATVQYAKVAEDQRRGVIHFHALVRLDGPATPAGFAPAPVEIGSEELAALAGTVAAAVRLDVPGVDGHDPARRLAFGRQIDVRVVRASRRPDMPDDVLRPEQVAGYLAKYATKSAADESWSCDQHHRRLREVTRRLAQRARAFDRLSGVEGPYAGLGRRVDSNGFRGHFSSKSRRYSITLGALRRARRRAQALLAEGARTGERVDLAAREAELLAAEDDEASVVLGTWTYVGSGWADRTETTLALAVAARAREYDRQRATQRKERKGNQLGGRNR